MNGYGEFIWKKGKKNKKEKNGLITNFFVDFGKMENGFRKFLKEMRKKISILIIKKFLKIKWKKETKIFENFEI